MSERFAFHFEIYVCYLRINVFRVIEGKSTQRTVSIEQSQCFEPTFRILSMLYLPFFQLYRHAGIAQSENIQYDADCTETLVQRTDMSGYFFEYLRGRLPVACKPVVDIGELGGLKVFTFDTFDQLGISLQYLLHSVQRIVYRSDLLRIEISDNERQSEEHAGYRYREQVQCTSYRDQYPDGRDQTDEQFPYFIVDQAGSRFT